MAINDIDIVRNLKTDPQFGFQMLMDKYEQPLYCHIRRLVVDYEDSKDAAQEAFIRIFRSFDHFTEGSFSAWLYRIATNEALRTIKRRKGSHLSLEKVLELSDDEYFDYADAEAVLLQKAIHQLPPKQQATFNMRYYDDLEYDTIAEAMNSTKESAKMNYHIAKEKIVKYMNQNG